MGEPLDSQDADRWVRRHLAKFKWQCLIMLVVTEASVLLALIAPMGEAMTVLVVITIVSHAPIALYGVIEWRSLLGDVTNMFPSRRKELASTNRGAQ